MSPAAIAGKIIASVFVVVEIGPFCIAAARQGSYYRARRMDIPEGAIVAGTLMAFSIFMSILALAIYGIWK